MIYIWIFIIVFPVVLVIQLMAQRKKARAQKEMMSGRHFITALIHTIILLLIAYAAYFLSLAINH